MTHHQHGPGKDADEKEREDRPRQTPQGRTDAPEGGEDDQPAYTPQGRTDEEQREKETEAGA